MRLLYLLPILLWIIPIQTTIAQGASEPLFCNDKACHIIEIEFDNTEHVPTYKSGSMEDIPYATPIYLKVVADKSYSFKVKIDTVIARVINPSDNVVGGPSEELLPQKKDSRDTTYIYIGAFDPGKQIKFTLFREEVKKTTKSTYTETKLDNSFITNTLQKGEEEHKKVNLLNILNSETHPNEKYLVKLDIKKTEIDILNDELAISEKETKSTEIAWKPYEDIFSIHNGNTTTIKTITENPVKTWKNVGGFSFHVPKRYRFRIKAGFNAAFIQEDVVSVQSRFANSGDIEGIDDSEFQLGFRSSQFRPDSTQVYRINTNSSESWEYSPVLMLSFYPVNRKSLGIDNSFIGYMKYDHGHSFGYALSQIFSFHVGTTLNNNAFKDYYVGLNLELFEGLDITYSSLSKNVTKHNVPFEYQDLELNGNTPFFTNRAVPDANEFLSKERTRFDSFSITVDGIIFQKAFASIFSTIKKGIVGE